MTAYKATKNQEYYYKYNTKRCKNNQRVEQVHEGFKEILNYLQVDKKYLEPLREHLKDKFADLNKLSNDKRKMLSAALKSVETKHEKLEEKYIYEGISKEVYQKHLARLRSEKTEIERDLNKPEIKLSNRKNK